MLQKLARGEYSLSKSFWQFGVCGIFAGSFILYIIKRILWSKIGVGSLLKYYFNSVNFMHVDVELLILTVLYVVCTIALFIYIIMTFLGVWRSSKEYEKSPILGFIARVFMIILIWLSFKVIF